MKKNTYNRRINGKKYYVKVVEYPYLLCHKKFENRWVECDPHSFAENAKTLLKQTKDL